MAFAYHNHPPTVIRGRHKSNRGGAPITQAGDDLSRREIEVLILCARGWEREEIAAMLNIELRTVKSHCSAAITKLHARNIKHAVCLGFFSGVITLSEVLSDLPPLKLLE